MKRSGFTMIELVIVIVVGGILAAVMIPRLERDPTREAANQIVRDIQYAQHLAMVDDVYNDTDPVWFQHRWQIWFKNSDGYAVGSYDLVTPAQSVIATNPGSQQKIDSIEDDSAGDLSDFDLTSITLAGGCAALIGNGDGPSIAFDNFGKPYKFTNRADFTGANATDHELTTPCTIYVMGDGKKATIQIEPQTGYVHLISVI